MEGQICGGPGLSMCLPATGGSGSFCRVCVSICVCNSPFGVPRLARLLGQLGRDLRNALAP